VNHALGSRFANQALGAANQLSGIRSLCLRSLAGLSDCVAHGGAHVAVPGALLQRLPVTLLCGLVLGHGFLGGKGWTSQSDPLRDSHEYELPANVWSAELGTLLLKMTARQHDARYANAREVLDVLDQIARDERALGASRTRELYELAVERAAGPNQAEALLALARFQRASKAAGARDAALGSYRRVLERFPDTRFGALAQDVLFVLEHLSVGGIAPDFEDVDVEGRAFKLSDYRGKVVVLDFWGFW